jgi:hypothetical protein
MRALNSTFYLCLILFVTAAATAQDHHHGSETSEEIALPDDLRALLADEMNQIDQGMQTLVTSLAAGRWHEVASTAKAIQASYILKQSLSGEQMKQLHDLLPAHFQELDKAFHQDAGKLAEAAKAHDADVAGLYFGRLVQGCMTCHSRYATETFSGFRMESAHSGH